MSRTAPPVTACQHTQTSARVIEAAAVLVCCTTLLLWLSKGEYRGPLTARAVVIDSAGEVAHPAEVGARRRAAPPRARLSMAHWPPCSAPLQTDPKGRLSCPPKRDAGPSGGWGWTARLRQMCGATCKQKSTSPCKAVWGCEG